MTDRLEQFVLMRIVALKVELWLQFEAKLTLMTHRRIIRHLSTRLILAIAMEAELGVPIILCLLVRGWVGWIDLTIYFHINNHKIYKQVWL